MKNKLIFTPKYLFPAYLVLGVILGCSSLSPTTRPSVLPIIQPPTLTRAATNLPVTATPQPLPSTSLIPTSTLRPIFSATPFPLILATPLETVTFHGPGSGEYKGELNAWCMPEKKPVRTPVGTNPAAIPDGAIEGRYYEHLQAFRLKIPAVFCTFVYNANVPIQTGTKFEISYPMSQKPWLSVEMKTVPDNPNGGYVVLTHSYILNPPAWEVSYKIVVRGNEGVEKFHRKIVLWKTLPEKCWDGTYPDPVTMWCPKNPTPESD